jgi:methylmalonyl-CoA mutase
MDLFMNAAMIRAARTLWATEMAQFKPEKPASSMLRTHSQTSGWTLTEQDPYNNIIRTTVEALAATLGGTQSLHTNAYDEALGLPTDFSARIARNTQIILQEESEICNTVDPLAGSYYVEKLTQEIIDGAKKIMKQIDEVGGMATAIEKGIPKRMIEEAAAYTQSQIDQGKKVIVGVNKYQIEEDVQTPVLKIDDSVRLEQIDSIEKVKKNRDEQAVQKALDDITHAAAKGDNLLEKAVIAAELRATLGEITSAMEKEFTRYSVPTATISGVVKKTYEDSAKIDEFENAVKKVDDFAKKHGRQPRILVAKIGQDGHDRGAKVVASAASDIGFDVDLTPMFSTPTEAAKIAVENDVHVIGVSSLGGGHLQIVPELAGELKKLGRSDIVITVGGVIPPQDYEQLKKDGAKAIFGPGTPMLSSLTEVVDLIS